MLLQEILIFCFREVFFPRFHFSVELWHFLLNFLGNSKLVWCFKFVFFFLLRVCSLISRNDNKIIFKRGNHTSVFKITPRSTSTENGTINMINTHQLRVAPSIWQTQMKYQILSIPLFLVLQNKMEKSKKICERHDLLATLAWNLITHVTCMHLINCEIWIEFP